MIVSSNDRFCQLKGAGNLGSGGWIIFPAFIVKTDYHMNSFLEITFVFVSLEYFK